MEEKFNMVLMEFEKYMNEYTFQKFVVSNSEVVYLIENSDIEFFYIDEKYYGRITLEEIFREGAYDFKLKKFENQIGAIIVQYFPFIGDLGYSNPYISSRVERVLQCLPELKVKERYNRWKGFRVQHIVFELIEGDKVGYALCQTSAKQTIKKVVDIGSDIFNALFSVSELNEIYQRFGYYDGRGFKYNIMFDQNMKDIVLARANTPNLEWRKKNLGFGKYGFEEKGMKYCWINAYIKHSIEHFNGKVIEDIKNGVYEDIDWYEYVLPENKWKSEQLVYELVNQMYKKKGVIYQHRPDFLRIGNRQLSYDVYICKLNIAIEYQGKQHFEPVEIFGGEEAFKKQQERDKLKRELSVQKGVHLIYINYWEDITTELIENKIKEVMCKIV